MLCLADRSRIICHRQFSEDFFSPNSVSPMYLHLNESEDDAGSMFYLLQHRVDDITSRCLLYNVQWPAQQECLMNTWSIRDWWLCQLQCPSPPKGITKTAGFLGRCVFCKTCWKESHFLLFLGSAATCIYVPGWRRMQCTKFQVSTLCSLTVIKGL